MSSNQPSGERTYKTERNREICEFYENHTQADTAAHFGITPARVYQILREENIPSRKRGGRGRKRLIDKDPISAFHAQIGQDISYRRNKMNMLPLEFSKLVGISKERLRAIELGVVDPTLSELAKIAKVIGIDIEVLTKPRFVTNLSGAA